MMKIIACGRMWNKKLIQVLCNGVQLGGMCCNKPGTFWVATMKLRKLFESKEWFTKSSPDGTKLQRYRTRYFKERIMETFNWRINLKFYAKLAKTVEFERRKQIANQRWKWKQSVKSKVSKLKNKTIEKWPNRQKYFLFAPCSHGRKN